MKAGVRALGVAESFTAQRSTLAGAVVRADRVVDGFGFETCTVGGTDVTDAITSLFADLGREDVQYVLVSGIAPAWFNIVDLHALADRLDRPIIAVSYEESDGLESTLREEFAGETLQERLDTYDRQPPRRRLAVNDESVFVRHVGIDDTEADDVVRAFTPEGGRPEPLRIARLAAQGADRFREQA